MPQQGILIASSQGRFVQHCPSKFEEDLSRLPKFHFTAGLPRSGSTLTAALLRQGARFHAGMSSPVAELFEGVMSQVSAGSEISTLVNQQQRARILLCLFDSYYADVDEPVIFDTNRSWLAQLPAIDKFVFPKASSSAWCETLPGLWIRSNASFVNNAFENTRLFNNSAERSTVYTRVEALATANRLVWVIPGTR